MPCGGIGRDGVKAFGADGTGNLWVVGIFDPRGADFGSITLAGATTRPCIFRARLTTTSTWLTAWGVESMLGIPDEMAIDAQSQLYLTGAFRGAVTIGPLVGTLGNTTVTSVGGSDVDVAMFDSTGLWHYVARAGGPGPDASAGLALLPNGQVAVTGQFMRTATFGSTTLRASGLDSLYSDVFVATVDVDGTWQWAASAGGQISPRPDRSARRALSGALRRHYPTAGGGTIVAEGLALHLLTTFRSANRNRPAGPRAAFRRSPTLDFARQRWRCPIFGPIFNGDILSEGFSNAHLQLSALTFLLPALHHCPHCSGSGRASFWLYQHPH